MKIIIDRKYYKEFIKKFPTRDLQNCETEQVVKKVLQKLAPAVHFTEGSPGVIVIYAHQSKQGDTTGLSYIYGDVGALHHELKDLMIREPMFFRRCKQAVEDVEEYRESHPDYYYDESEEI